MITQREISTFAARLSMNDKVIEKDYVLTWLLFALADSELKDYIVFKGGTALKKIYFPDYRYSEDLDFTVVKGIATESLVDRVQTTLDRLAKEQAFEFDLPADKIEKRTDSVTVYINFAGPLQARIGSRAIKVDFTLSEKMTFPVKSLAIHSSYSDAVTRSINTYSLEEILTEKLCALIGRTEPRDIYDAHYLFGLKDIDLYRIADAFNAKAKFKEINPSKLAEALEKKQATLARAWEVRLQEQVKNLPHFDTVFRELNRNIRKHLNQALSRTRRDG